MYLAPCRRCTDSQYFFRDQFNFIYKDIPLNQLSIDYEYCYKKIKLAHQFITLKGEMYTPRGLVSILLLEAELQWSQSIIESPNVSLKSEQGSRYTARTVGSALSGRHSPPYTSSQECQVTQVECVSLFGVIRVPIPTHLVPSPSSEVRRSRSKGQWLGKTGGTVYTMAGHSHLGRHWDREEGGREGT